MSRLERMEDGNDDDMFVMTRDQVGFLVKNSYACGKTGGFYPKSFECVGSYEDCVHSDDDDVEQEAQSLAATFTEAELRALAADEGICLHHAKGRLPVARHIAAAWAGEVGPDE